MPGAQASWSGDGQGCLDVVADDADGGVGGMGLQDGVEGAQPVMGVR